MKIETPILRRLGPVPFWRGERKCLDSFEVMYRKAIERAQSLAPQVQGGVERDDRSRRSYSCVL